MRQLSQVCTGSRFVDWTVMVDIVHIKRIFAFKKKRCTLSNLRCSKVSSFESPPSNSGGLKFPFS